MTPSNPRPRLVRVLAAFAAPVAALFLSTLAPAQEQEMELTAVADNTLFESATGSLSNGAGQYLFAGNTNQATNFRRRALVRFDLAGSLPANATITSVELRMTMSRTIAGEVSVRLRRAAKPWGEEASDATGQEGAGIAAQPGDATWLHSEFDTVAWDTPGGDFAAEVSGSAVVGNAGDYAWTTTPEMVADAQGWLDDPDSNFGWFLIASEGFSPTAKRFNSREATNPATRPRLVVRYTVPPPPPEVVGVMTR